VLIPVSSQGLHCFVQDFWLCIERNELGYSATAVSCPSFGECTSPGSANSPTDYK